MSRKAGAAGILAGMALGGALALICWYRVRPWHRRWGATDDELASALPGDDMLPAPRLNATHAVTIAATPAEIWPWLVQLGWGRGGFYSYASLENAMGLDMHNANTILPIFQDLKVGDRIPFDEKVVAVPVAILERERAMVLYGDTRVPGPGAPPVKPGEFLATSWGFYLFPRGDGTTRLLARWRADWSPTFANNVMYTGFLEPGGFIMQRKMLLGIKQRAERGAK